ncbi:dipeptide epimerase [Paenibacillus thalictri]|uniref:Dipeptide epimerase n=1 Tax=Paenibacillus thalictri TaxID=2527873 RepID=A0A4Q9DP69_9BACL|nr:dipeptide epimerase [Paenibacillus thalictri]TBL76008.1 dipeptide epimerase [Paenibacillus thalictri]
MRITRIETSRLRVPLKKPFKTALRTVHTAESVIVRIAADSGHTGWGEAPPTLAITGESVESIEAFIHGITPKLVGESPLLYERLLPVLHGAAVRNSSAKAAVEMALYDLLAQHGGVPLYQLLGGHKNEIETDFTVSVGSPEEMGEDAVQYVKSGFTVLKIKVGLGDADLDIRRVKAIRERIGYGIKLRLDANQGWDAKTAVRLIRAMEDGGLDIELVEQPVKAHDIAGLGLVTSQVDTPIMADESVFSPADALEVIRQRSADLINIKLMKAGGMYHAETICRMAEASGMECMIGSMIESRVGASAAAHFAAAKRNVTRVDLDSPLMMSEDAVEGGVMYEGNRIVLPDVPGLGIFGVRLREPQQ